MRCLHSPAVPKAASLRISGWTTVKVLGLGVLYVGGTRVVPWFLLHVAKLQSRELFTLAVLGIALGIAYGSAVLLSVSMALGAFLGGMIVGQSELSHQAAADALPLRDAFAVLFFVSVGMLFEPQFLVDRPLLVLATLAIIVVVKPLSAILITLLLGYPIRTGLTVGAGLGPIGGFLVHRRRFGPIHRTAARRCPSGNRRGGDDQHCAEPAHVRNGHGCRGTTAQAALAQSMASQPKWSPR